MNHQTRRRLANTAIYTTLGAYAAAVGLLIGLNATDPAGVIGG
jgi:hypothetical protein